MGVRTDQKQPIIICSACNREGQFVMRKHKTTGVWFCSKGCLENQLIHTEVKQDITIDITYKGKKASLKAISTKQQGSQLDFKVSENEYGVTDGYFRLNGKVGSDFLPAILISLYDGDKECYIDCPPSDEGGWYDNIVDGAYNNEASTTDNTVFPWIPNGDKGKTILDEVVIEFPYK